MTGQVLYSVQGLIYFGDIIQICIVVKVVFQIWILDVREIGHAIETLGRVRPVIVRLEAVKPRISKLDCLVVILIFLLFRQDWYLENWVLI